MPEFAIIGIGSSYGYGPEQGNRNYACLLRMCPDRETAEFELNEYNRIVTPKRLKFIIEEV